MFVVVRRYVHRVMALENPRKTRAFGIIGQAQGIRQIKAHTFKVRSQSGNGQYVVTNGEGKFECTCPDFQYRVKEGKIEACKHVLAVQFYEKLRQDDTDTISLAQDLALSCKFCGSSSLVKRGKRKTRLGMKAQYECKACGRWFVHNGTHLPRARVDERLQGMAVDLYFSGFSVRKIKRFLEEYYRVRVSHVAVYKWLHKYGRLLAEYTSRFKPQQSGVWNADEMMVKLAHQPETRQVKSPKGVGGPWFYLWNIMDNQTRFLLTSRFSFSRDYTEASEAFKQARSVAREAPSVVVTDGLPSYVGAYAQDFKELRNIVHLSRSSLKSGRNARIERLNGTVREREKVMRALKHEKSGQELLNAYRVWYNYIRPHMGLGGLTPAQAAEVPLDLGRNKMLNLIRKARSKT
jgi:putative transposase